MLEPVGILHCRQNLMFVMSMLVISVFVKLLSVSVNHEHIESTVLIFLMTCTLNFITLKHHSQQLDHIMHALSSIT